MRRISLAFALTALLLPSTALALQHHKMTIGEVLLSSGGEDGIEYIELIDPGEGFPNGTYALAIYDADGTLIDSVDLAVAPGTTRLLVGTAAADTEFDTERDATLPVTLPPAGQACFETTGGTKFGCAAWGCVNTILSGSTNNGRGASPPDGMSLQAQVNDETGIVESYRLGEPTPDATNVEGTAAPACPTDPDAGPSDIDAGTDDADAGPDGPDGGGGGGGDGGDGDDDSGCGCGTSSPRSAASGLLLVGVFLVAGRLRRVRGRGTRT
jgi:hypothetical protein